MTPKSPAPGNVERAAEIIDDIFSRREGFNVSGEEIVDALQSAGLLAPTPSEDAMAAAREWHDKVLPKAIYSEPEWEASVKRLATLLQSAQARGIERAAKVAEEHAERSSTEMDNCKHCDESYVEAMGATTASRDIAASIRALVQP